MTAITRAESSNENSAATESFAVSAPSISLPKGGGAIRGIGEKFAANPVTGTGSMGVPIFTSPGRSGFGPQLALSYDSGSGNGPFGFGWSLSLPAITRKTDKGLPTYRDADEADVFILSGAEDLVPVLGEQGGSWVREALPDRSVDGEAYRVQRYRPRIEGLFARIERWTNVADAKDVHWRSISKDNVLTVYGKDENSRIADPEDPERIFSWLICETRDDKGNAVVYRYKAEDGAGIDLRQAHERNRGDYDDPRRTANRYLKRILYGNRVPLLADSGQRPLVLTEDRIENAGWMFEVVFDYGEHDSDAPTPNDAGIWVRRQDPFSSYRSGFEVRTYRLCQRVLMFHHFPDEEDVGSDCVVRSTDFTYSHDLDPADARNPVYTFLLAATQSGYRRHDGGYLRRSLPTVEFEYTKPAVQNTVERVDGRSLENLPIGLDGKTYQWTDLHGEGIPGILTEQGGAWLYKRNVSPLGAEPGGDGGEGVQAKASFAPVEVVSVQPNLTLAGGRAQFMDLAGDGQPDLVVLDGPTPGLYEHDGDEGWQPFRPFASRLGRSSGDPNLRFVDLDGDGHADVLITEDRALAWHASLAEEGFGPAQHVAQALDEEEGPRLVFDDGTQSIYLADLSGDGLTDLARIRNGEVCFWPNLGYGRFGAKVTMDHAPRFDTPDQFDHARIRLADIDGTGTTDIIYLHRDGVRLYFNQSGNSWGESQTLDVFPRVDELVSIVPTDLLGNGTACLVWSSPLPGDARMQMRYVDLMGGQKPHLLVKTRNNLGAETHVHYAPSTKFYLADKLAGEPWITRLPFPVHVVERVETYDRVSRNRFVTRYAYHHGYFDGEEREFRGFGMVEQWDTEQLAAFSASDDFPTGDNIDVASHVPPTHSKTWFHTGAFLDGHRISREFEGEYYREPGLSDAQFLAQLLPDTNLPLDLSTDETREACRALKGMMLRQEVYANDAAPGSSTAAVQRARTPYTVVEQDFTIRRLQPRAGNRHAVLFTHPREAITYHYERNPTDPRVAHAVTLEVDDFGNVLRSVAVGYGRRQPDVSLAAEDRMKQSQTLITWTENRFTNAIEAEDDYRAPLPCEARTYELTGLGDADDRERFSFATLDDAGRRATPIPYEAKPTTGLEKRLLEHTRTLYRRNDLAAPLVLGRLESLALPFESYRLAVTPNHLTQVLGDRVTDAMLVEGGYVHSEGDADWWIPSGRVFYSPDPPPDPTDPAAYHAGELAHARDHFFLPYRVQDPFGNSTYAAYDGHDLLVVQTTDAVGNTVTARNHYRVLQPNLVTDPNGNRTQVAYDAWGLVAGTAVMGKESETLGDSLAGFDADLTPAQLDAFFADPTGRIAYDLLANASTRVIYDLNRYRNSDGGTPVYAATLTRETHASDRLPAHGLRLQIGFGYSDGFGRVIQEKAWAEPGPLRVYDPDRNQWRDEWAGPGRKPFDPRWVVSGWTIFNNKGEPVRQYEPFFDNDHDFSFGRRMGVSPVLFYDPVGRVVATLHPNHTYEKIVFTPWRRETWDVNDTVLLQPHEDPDIGHSFQRLPETEHLPTWHARRISGNLGDAERTAARQTEVHAATPAVAHFDSLGRSFLTVAHNRFERDGSIVEEPPYETRVQLDLEGNQHYILDARNNAVMVYTTVTLDGDGRLVTDGTGRPVTGAPGWHVAGRQLYTYSMDAGQRWMLPDVSGQPLYAWDVNDRVTLEGETVLERRVFHSLYDALRRPVEHRLAINGGTFQVIERLEYGEDHPEAGSRNLRGQLYRHYDPSGLLTNERFDFKGNMAEARRRLASEYQAPVIDWSDGSPTNALEDELFTRLTEYDALNRTTRLYNWHRSDERVAVYEPRYNHRGLLEAEDLIIGTRRTASGYAGGALTTAVSELSYDAKGERQHMLLGNGTRTRYHYDPETFRLVQLRTTRPASHDPRFPDHHSGLGDDSVFQQLNYSYDPSGNITEIYDEAYEPVFFRNQRVEPRSRYTYDALYRLIEATGRENYNAEGAPPHRPPEGPAVEFPRTDQALRNYTERYVYDSVGNILQMRHIADAGSWTRSNTYADHNNRHIQADTNDPEETIPYEYDIHGSMLNLNRTPDEYRLRWDYRDMIHTINLGGGGWAYYNYDVRKQRTRKVITSPEGTKQWERLYLAGAELYHRWAGGSLVEEIETHHLFVENQRVLMLDNVLATDTSDLRIEAVLRYHYANHVGSVALELDGDAAIISHEEYHPYGTTAYAARGRDVRATAKRYRYTGMERDEESGLSYHTARYYAPWLARWTSVDPTHPADGLNPFQGMRDSPPKFRDPRGTAVKLGYSAEDNQAATRGINSRTGETAEVQLRSIQRFLRAVGDAQARDLGLEGDEAEQFARAEFEAITIRDGQLHVDLESARAGRGRSESWVLRRLWELAHAEEVIEVVTVEEIESVFAGGESLGVTVPSVTTGRRRTDGDSAVLAIASRNRSRPTFESRLVRPNLTPRADPSTHFAESRLDYGETFVHELTIHAWREVFAPSARRVPEQPDTISIDPGAQGHVAKRHRIGSPQSSEAELNVHAQADLEADLLEFYALGARQSERPLSSDAVRRLGGVQGGRVERVGFVYFSAPLTF